MSTALEQAAEVCVRRKADGELLTVGSFGERLVRVVGEGGRWVDRRMKPPPAMLQAVSVHDSLAAEGLRSGRQRTGRNVELQISNWSHLQAKGPLLSWDLR